jgi:hypothetical protein
MSKRTASAVNLAILGAVVLLGETMAIVVGMGLSGLLYISLAGV